MRMVTIAKGCLVHTTAGIAFLLATTDGVFPSFQLVARILRRSSVVIIQQATQPLLALHWSDCLRRRSQWHDQPISQALMISFKMVQPDNEILILPEQE